MTVETFQVSVAGSVQLPSSTQPRMHHAIPELMLADITEATSSRFPSELSEESPRCAWRGRTERRNTRQLMSVAEWTLTRAMAASESFLNSSEHIGFSNAFPILRGQKGEPLWPEGIAGSITHCYPWNVAVAAKCSNPMAID